MTFVLYFVGGLVMGGALASIDGLIARLSGGETHEFISLALFMLVPAIAAAAALIHIGFTNEIMLSVALIGCMVSLSVYGLRKSVD